ncbi:MAG: Uma2 family endonuclease [Spirochaetota bacterium]
MPTRVSVRQGTDYELLTADDFLDRLEPGKHADLIDGEVAVHSPVSLNHAALLNFLDRLIGQYVDRYRLGTLFREVVAVRLSSRNVFMPDLAFYRAGREADMHETYVAGPPDLAVEVISPRTGERDVGPKFAEYEQHGVREYWILDPETLAHRFYRRDGEILVEYADGESRIDSAVIDRFFVLRDWLVPASPPPFDDSLAAIEADRT